MHQTLFPIFDAMVLRQRPGSTMTATAPQPGFRVRAKTRAPDPL
jgi:hypothetical protein